MIWRTDIELNSTEIKGSRIFKYCGELMQKNWRTRKEVGQCDQAICVC